MNTVTLDLNTIVHRAVDVPFTQLDNELLAIDAQAGYVYSMNATASRVWELIDHPCTVGDVCSRLRQEFAVDETTCQREVLALLQSLHRAGLVRTKS